MKYLIVALLPFLAFGQTATTTALSAVDNPVTIGAPTTLHADVRPVGTAGPVTFWDGIQLLGVAQVGADGRASLAVRFQVAGRRWMRAVYVGAGAHAGSRSAPLSLTARANPGAAYRTRLAHGDTRGMFLQGDFDGNGFPDFTMAEWGSPWDTPARTLIGRGDGSFALREFSGAKAADRVADFNLDGKNDLFGLSHNGALTLSPGRGDGTFAQSVSTGTIATTESKILPPVAADFNRDGRPDVVQLSGTNQILVLLGRGDGTLQPALVTTLADQPRECTAGDWNNDGDPDLICTFLAFTAIRTEIRILLGGGNGYFQLPRVVSPSAAGYVHQLTSADFNGDGNSDLAYSLGSSSEDVRLAVLLGNGDGSFTPAPASAETGYISAMLANDFDGDGKLDLVISGGEGWNAMFAGNGDGSFRPTSRRLAAIVIHATADYNNDGIADMLTGQIESLSVFLGSGQSGTTVPSHFTIAHMAGYFLLPVTLDSPAATFFAAPSPGDWLEVPHVQNSGSGLLKVGAGSNGTSQPRTTTLLVNDQAVQVTQIGTPAIVTVNPTWVNMPAAGGDNNFWVVTSAPETAWTALSDSSWLTFLSISSGTGSQNIGYRVAANPGANSRVGTITVLGRTLTIMQAGTSAPVEIISPSRANVTAAPGLGLFDLRTTRPWTAVSNQPWARIEKPTGSGNYGIYYRYDPNGDAAPRTAQIRVGDVTFTLTQLGSAPALAIYPDEENVTAAGGSGTITVTASSPQVGYSVATQSPWLTFGGAGVGSGSGEVTWRALPNPSTEPRVGTMSINGHVFTVRQLGNPCPVSVRGRRKLPRLGGAITLTVTAGDCNWTAYSNDSWLALQSSGSGCGPGTVTVLANSPQGDVRTGTVTIGSTPVPIKQPWGDSFWLFRNGMWLFDAGEGFSPEPGWLGQAGDTPLKGSWTGGTRDEIGMFRAGMWLLDLNGNHVWDGDRVDRIAFLGQAGDIPITGDWNGDGRTKIGFFRNGMWLLDYNGTGYWEGPEIDRLYWIGQAGDVPVVGDWNGDGRAKIGFFRNGMWLLDYNGNGAWDGPQADRLYWIGQAGDTPLIADWNGDGRAKIGFFRAGMWLLDYNGNGAWEGPQVDRLYWLGQAGDKALLGDWNGSGVPKIGIFRNGLWLLDLNGNGGWDGASVDRLYFAGAAGDTPLVAAW